MKQCPSCSTKNPDSAKFCQGCGANLDGVEAIRTDFSGTANDLLTKAGNILSDSAKKAKEAAADKVAKAKGSVTAGKVNIQSTVQAGGWDKPAPPSDGEQLNGGWENIANSKEASSVTVKKYSFFQSEEEETVAVIGESAAASDLEGTYRGPYAVLTKERLYCKNEEGNFIIAASEILSAKEISIRKYEWAFWVAVVIAITCGISVLIALYADISSGYSVNDGYIYLPATIAMIAAGISIYFHSRNDLKKTSIALAFTSLGLPLINVIFVAIYLCQAWKNRTATRIFSIHCVGKSFPFSMDNYPDRELLDFQNQVCLLTGRPLEFRPNANSGNGTPKVDRNSYQPSQVPKQSGGRKGSPIVTAAAVIVILAVLIFAGTSIFHALTTCKFDGCDNEVYKDGYCTMHYAGNQVNQAAGDFFDSLFG